MPNSRRRYAGGELVVVLPLRSQNVVLRLSPLLRTVRSRASKVWAMASRWMSPPASSRSEFVIVPAGLSDVTRRLLMYSGHSRRHMTGMSACQPTRGLMLSPGNQTPPAPLPDASWCPSAEGASGMISASLVGRVVRSLAIHLKSSRAWWTPFPRFTLVVLCG